MRKLPLWLEKIEIFVDRSTPFLLVLLAVLIVVEFTHVAEEYHDILILIDQFIIGFFVVDLCFKWYRTHDMLKFLRLYWIDIIAVFPFYALFRAYFAITEAFAAGESAQKFLHEAVLLRETKLLKEAKVLREAEYAAKFAKEARIIRLVARSLRLLRARWYVTHWHMHHASKIRAMRH